MSEVYTTEDLVRALNGAILTGYSTGSESYTASAAPDDVRLTVESEPVASYEWTGSTPVLRRL